MPTTGAPNGELTDPLVGRLLDGRYRIAERIARGGMAGIYRATDTRLEREVAIKVMHAGLGDDHAFAERFVREAKSAARLTHPNVVSIYDQGEDDGVVYLAMELIRGRTLRDLITDEAPLPPARALALIEPVLSALAAAHRAGMIHRDVKPENVLIGGDGRVKVADFGLAKAVSADTQHTATGGVLIGTVSYLAPELVVDGRADARADVYSAGVMLYELLTGRKPHTAETPIQVAYKAVHEDVPAPSAAVPGIAPYVDALVARATARDPSQRPADASVLLHQVHRVSHAVSEGAPDDPDLTRDLTPLRTAITEEIEIPEPETQPVPTGSITVTPVKVPAPVEARPVGPVRITTAAPRRRWRGPVALLLALLLAGGIGAGAWWFGWARYTPVPGVLNLTEVEAVKVLEQAGLEAEVTDPAYSESVRAGNVIATDPAPGDKVLDGGSVAVTVSLGKERYDVPDLVGKTEDQAQDALTATKLAFAGSTRRYDEEVAKGKVIRSDPPAGTRVRPDTAVSLVISRGPRPLKVVDWTGKDADTAIAALESKQLVVEVSEDFSDTVAEGSVISQEPAKGTLFRGDQVRLVVSLGPELIAVPEGLVGMGVDAARQAVRDAGFRVQVEQSASYIGLGFVLSTDPGGGELAPRGSVVTLFLV